MVFYRSLMRVILIAVASRRNGWGVYSSNWKIHIFRSLACFAGMMLLYYAIGVLTNKHLGQEGEPAWRIVLNLIFPHSETAP